MSWEKYNWSEEFGGQSFIDGHFTCNIAEWPCNWFDPDDRVTSGSTVTAPPPPPGSSSSTATIASPYLPARYEPTIVLSDGTKLHPDLLNRLSSGTISSVRSVRGSIDHPADGGYRLVLGDPTNTQHVDYVDLIDTGKVSWAYGSSNWSYHTFIPKAEIEFTPSNPRINEGKRGGKWVVEEVRAWPKDEDPVVSGSSKDSEGGEKENEDEDEDEDDLEEQEGPGSDQSGPELDPEGEIEIITRYIPREATLGSASDFGSQHRPAPERGSSQPDLHIQLDLGSVKNPTGHRIDPNFPVVWV